LLLLFVFVFCNRHCNEIFNSWLRDCFCLFVYLIFFSLFQILKIHHQKFFCTDAETSDTSDKWCFSVLLLRLMLFNIFAGNKDNGAKYTLNNFADSINLSDVVDTLGERDAIQRDHGHA